MSKKVYVALTSIAFEAEDDDTALLRAIGIGKMLGTLVEHPIRVINEDIHIEDSILGEFRVYVSRPHKALSCTVVNGGQSIL